MSNSVPQITLPAELRPGDGRFGSGPSLVDPEALNRLAATGATFMGTSHRRPAVRDVVAEMQAGLARLFSLPDGYEVVLGNGGATCFWDMTASGLIDSRSQHLSFGEFSSKFAAAVAQAPHLDDPMIIETPPGTHPFPVVDPSVDVYALTHNETSTGVTMPINRVEGDALTVVDATSAAAGVRVDAEAFDIYYFSPQKALGADGGLFIALCSPRAIERIEMLDASDRWVPPFLSLANAVANSRKNQTYNTPALATVFLTADTVRWIDENGGLEFSTGRCDANAAALYSWAEASSYATPFVVDPQMRSPVTGTIDLDDAISADTVAAVLRSNGIIDTESYRKLGRNQLRVGLWPSIETADVAALTASVDHIVDRL